MISLPIDSVLAEIARALASASGLVLQAPPGAGKGTDRARFARPLRASFASFMGAFERLCRDAGLPPATARARAESAIVRVEGALVVSAGTGDTGVFHRTLRDLRETLLQRTV